MYRPTGPTESALLVRGSRFLAGLERAGDPDAARMVRAVRIERHPDATHHCWAYRVWEGGEPGGAGFDAGEPSGTAGRPILGALERSDLMDAVCVVSRWFGGTRLGTGGLTRAYADAARTAVEAAREAGRLEAVASHARFAVSFGYEATGAVERTLSRFRAREEGSEYGECVRRTVIVPIERAGAFPVALREATAGEVETERLADRLASPVRP